MGPVTRFVDGPPPAERRRQCDVPNKSPPNNAIASPSIAVTALTCGDHSGFGAEIHQKRI